MRCINSSSSLVLLCRIRLGGLAILLAFITSETTTWAGTIATCITAAVVIWYTIETARMRQQLVLQNERSVLPFIAVDFEGQDFKIKNIGM